MKKLYAGLIASTLLVNLQAQSFSWANRAGLWAYDYGYGITTDNAGNVYVAGKYEMTADFNGITLPCQGNHDIYLAKYTSSGTIDWVQTGGGSLGDYAHALATDGSNYIYVAGEIEGYGNQIIFPGSSITLNSVGNNDVFLCKYDINGNLIWARSAGAFKNDKAVGVTFDNSGNVFICGLFTDTCVFGGSTMILGHGKEDIFVAKYDANGTFQWVQNAGSSERDEPKGIKCDAAGNVYVCGFYSNGAIFGSQTLNAPNNYFESFVAKFSNSGSLQWVTTGGGNYDDVAWDLELDNSASRIYVSGEFNASANFGSTQLITHGNADVYVACYDFSGNTIWATGAGGTLIDRARGMGSNATNIFITGQFGSSATFGGHTLNAADSSDIFFVSLDKSGNFQGALAVGGQADSVETLGYESGIDICATAAGDVFGTGAMLDGGVFGSTTLGKYARTDMFVTRISQLTNINQYAAGQHAVPVYPNPGTGSFVIEPPHDIYERTETVVYNSLGSIISKRTDNSFTRMNIDLSGSESGVYFLEIKSGGREVVREKLLIQR